MTSYYNSTPTSFNWNTVDIKEMNKLGVDDLRILLADKKTSVIVVWSL